MIPAGIKAANVEIPMIVRQDQEIRFGQVALALAEPPNQFFIGRQIPLISVEYGMPVNLFVQPNDRVRVNGQV